MTIELFDMDIPYTVSIDCNADGIDFVKLKLSSDDDDDANFLALDKEQCKQLARVLNFISEEIK